MNLDNSATPQTITGKLTKPEDNVYFLPRFENDAYWIPALDEHVGSEFVFTKMEKDVYSAPEIGFPVQLSWITETVGTRSGHQLSLPLVVK